MSFLTIQAYTYTAGGGLPVQEREGGELNVNVA
jgi:hypothetical protein